jgi:hypothetical protein
MAKSMEEVLKELQDTLTVMAGIQARQAEIQKGHSEWLQEHDRVMTELRERDKIIDERIDKLVLSIGEWISRSGR